MMSTKLLLFNLNTGLNYQPPNLVSEFINSGSNQSIFFAPFGANAMGFDCSKSWTLGIHGFMTSGSSIGTLQLFVGIQDTEVVPGNGGSFRSFNAYNFFVPLGAAVAFNAAGPPVFISVADVAFNTFYLNYVYTSGTGGNMIVRAFLKGI